MNIQGKVETTSKEGELGAPQGYYWIKLADMDILVSITMNVKVGEQLSIEAINTNLGLRAQRIEKIDSQAKSDYQSLVTECKGIVERAKRSAEDFIKANWELGKRLLDVETVYGEGTISKLAKDLTVDPSHIYHCIRFAEKHPQFSATKISPILDRIQNLTWRDIRKSLAEPRKSTSLPDTIPVSVPLPSNPSATPAELRHAYDPSRKPLPTEGNEPARFFREILTWLEIPHTSEKELHVNTERGPRTYHADFFANHTVLEVDSSAYHDPDKDAQRDKDILTLGFETERFLDTDIAITHKTLSRLREIAAVEEAIPA